MRKELKEAEWERMRRTVRGGGKTYDTKKIDPLTLQLSTLTLDRLTVDS